MNYTEINELNPACFGDYLSAVLGFLFLLSEVMGAYQKSKCKNDVIDEDGYSVPKLEKKESFLQSSNGLFHSLVVIASKFKKK